MGHRFRTSCIVGCFAGLSILGAPQARAGAHTWDVQEIFSNAAGTIQFVELFEANGTANEVNVPGQVVKSNSKTYVIPAPALTPPTSNKRLLFATAAFAALPGAPTPNYIFPAGSTPFFSTGGDTITYGPPYDATTFGAGQLPTDGVNSFNKGGTTGPATPQNYAGATFAPPGVSGLLAAKVPGFADGSRLTLSWNTGSCLGANKYHIVYGFGSQLPASLGGPYGLQAAGVGQCSIASSPKVWSGIPDPAVDATDFLWFLVLADNGATTEGSWGDDSGGSERTGPAAGGGSGQCSMTAKNLANTCQ